jgi:cell division protein FtsL
VATKKGKEMITMIATFLIFGIMVMFVVQPLFLTHIPKIEDSESSFAILKQNKKILYRQIKELEMDYQLGNINKEDYLQLRNGLKKEVSEILTMLNN